MQALWRIRALVRELRLQASHGGDRIAAAKLSLPKKTAGQAKQPLIVVSHQNGEPAGSPARML
jgi:hypothetical protein